MERSLEDIEGGGSPKSPHKRYNVHNERPIGEEGWQAQRPILIQPANHTRCTLATGCLQLPPPRIARKLIHVVLGYLLCMGLSLMLIRWAMAQLPNPDSLVQKVDSPQLLNAWTFPRSFDDLRRMQSTLEAYRADYFPQLMRAFCLLYLFMQCFTIPGCFFFTVLLGSLLPHIPATVVATVLITLGCLANYQLSKYALTDVLLYAIPNQVRYFQQAVSDQGAHNLFSYMTLLRVVPILPSWMLNFASPLANVPIGTFAATAVIGFQPQIFIMIAGGRTISRLHSWKDIYHWQSIVTLAICAVLSILPVLLRRWVLPISKSETPV